MAAACSRWPSVGEALRDRVGLRAQVEEAPAVEHALDRLHLVAHRAVAPRLAGLALEARELLLDLVDDVVDAEEVLLRGLELQLRRRAARLVAGDAGGLFDQVAALLRACRRGSGRSCPAR